jgi:hypothetical protein
MLPTRVKLLLAEGHSCYRPRRTGERKRKSVRGCIVAQDLAVLALAVVKQGEQDIPGLTDTVQPKRLGPKRATKIRRFFGLSKQDDVRYGLPCLMQMMVLINATASSSSAVRSLPRKRVRSPTPRPPRSRDSSLLNASSTRDTASPSREDARRLPRMLQTSMLSCWLSVCTRSVRRRPSCARDVLRRCTSRRLARKARTPEYRRTRVKRSHSKRPEPSQMYGTRQMVTLAE